MIITKYNKFLESNENDMWSIIPQSIKDIHTIFSEQSKQLFVVGGSVRDFILEKTPKDFDLATNATPDEILKIIGNKYRTNLQGKAFGVIVVFPEDQPKGIEIATFRSDIYDGKLGTTRNPNIKFTTINEDSERRDLSINALYYDLSSRKIVDLVGGVNDIKNKIARFVGDPDLRIQEDPLRSLRCARFSCRFGFLLDEESKKAIIKNKKSLTILSRERIWEEIEKAFEQVNDFSSYFNLLNELELWEQIFDQNQIKFKPIKAKYLEVYIAMLLKDNSGDDLAKTMVQTYKINLDFTKKVIFLIKMQLFSINNVFNAYKAKIACHISNDMILEWFSVLNINKDVFKEFYKFLEYRPTISAQELMSKGFQKKALGDEIERLETIAFKKLLN